MNACNLNTKNKQAELNATTVLMVSNISRNITKKHLQEIFSPYGELKGVYVPRNEETKIQKSYVFLEYGNQENAEKAMLYFSGGQIDGLIVKVEILNPDILINNSNKIKTKDENPTNNMNRNKEKDSLSNSQVQNENEESVKNLEEKENNIDNKKRIKSRSRSRKRSISNSNPRYRRNNYKYTHGYSNSYYGHRRYQDYNERNKRKYKRKDSKSSGRSSEKSSSRSSRSSS